MLHFRINTAFLTICLLFILSTCVDKTEREPFKYSRSENYKIFITSDMHFFPESLCNNPAAPGIAEAEGDGKLLAYNEKIMEAFVNDVLTDKPDAVILSGDLTLNGEKQGHLALTELLGRINSAGIRVFVIPGNHDINNPQAGGFENGRFYPVASVSPQEFRETYRPFGYEGALYYDKHSLSYITRLNDYLYAVMIDSCMYERTFRKLSKSDIAGTIFPVTLRWLQRSIRSIKIQNKDAQFITVIHHNVFPHNRNFTANYVINSANKAIKKFLQLNLNIFFSGHIHIQHILSNTTADGITMTEIVNSSLVTYPVAYGVAEFDRSGMIYHTREINMSAYARQNSLEDENLFNFEEYSRTMFNERAAERLSDRLREQQYPKEIINEAVQAIKLINTYYFAGRIDEIPDEIKLSRGFQLVMNEEHLRRYVRSTLEEGRGEHNFIEIKW